MSDLSNFKSAFGLLISLNQAAAAQTAVLPVPGAPSSAISVPLPALSLIPAGGPLSIAPAPGPANIPSLKIKIAPRSRTTWGGARHPSKGARKALETGAAAALLGRLASIGGMEKMGDLGTPSSSRASASALFDGSLPRAGGEIADLPAESPREDWKRSSFPTRSGGALQIRYKALTARGNAGKAPTVFLGGLGLSEGFESLFQTQGTPAADQYFLWLRGNPPTGWAPSAEVLESDARDLAAMIAIAAERSRSGTVNLALHSYATLVFQRLLTLRGNPDADKALALLRGGRVSFLHGTTHSKGAAGMLGPAYEVRKTMTEGFLGFLDANDALSSLTVLAASFNPFLILSASFYLAAWNFCRGSLLDKVGRDLEELYLKGLSEPWDDRLEGVRRRLLDTLKKSSRDPGWQEGMVRRLVGWDALDFRPEHAELIRELGIRLDIVYGVRERVLPWETQIPLLKSMGIAAPPRVPPAGTVLQDRSGLIRFVVVDSDHLFPLRKPADLERILGGDLGND
jgi:hypothetical protein